MNRRTLSGLAVWGIGALSACLLGASLAPGARAADAPRATYDFEDGTQGFVPFAIKDGQFNQDAASIVTVTKDKNLVKSGAGSLAYSYTIEPAATRTLAVPDLRVPANSTGVRFWIRSDAESALVLSVRPEGGGSYDLSFFVPANEWVSVAANWDELAPGEGKKPGDRLAPEQIRSLSLLDMASVLSATGADLRTLIPDFKPARTLWLDDFQFTAERAPQSAGPAKTDAGNAHVVDNFESGVIRWMPVRADIIDNAPKISLFPADAGLKILPEAAGPGMARTPVEAGGKGLRFSYHRGPKSVFALNQSLEKLDLSRADHLRLNLNMSQKSLVLVQIKEKKGAEYNQVLMPDNTVGWQTLDFPLSSFTLGDNSKDDNNMLDADQIKEITILDATAFLGAGADADVTMELDAVYFTLK